MGLIYIPLELRIEGKATVVQSQTPLKVRQSKV